MKSVLWPNAPTIGGMGSAFHPMKIHILFTKGGDKKKYHQDFYFFDGNSCSSWRKISIKRM